MTTIPASPGIGSSLRRHKVFGRVGLALSFLPWLVFGAMLVFRPG